MSTWDDRCHVDMPAVDRRVVHRSTHPYILCYNAQFPISYITTHTQRCLLAFLNKKNSLVPNKWICLFRE